MRYTLKAVVLAGSLIIALAVVGCSGATDSFEQEKEKIREKAQEKATARAHGIISDDLKQKIKEEVNESVPPLNTSKLKEEARQLYQAKEIGDHVSFVIRQGRGSDPTVEGVFMEEAKNRIKIGSRWVFKDDMEKRDLAMFDKELRERFCEEYVRRKKDRNSKLRAERRRELYEKAKQKLRDAGLQGYVDTSKSLEENISRMLRPEIEREMLKDAGFVLKDGEWQPSLRKRLLDN